MKFSRKNRPVRKTVHEGARENETAALPLQESGFQPTIDFVTPNLSETFTFGELSGETEAARSDSLRPAHGEIPTAAGVYRFLDKHGRILYIGKAKNLRNRLNNYFQPLHSLPVRTRRMVQMAAHLDWTVVANDTESLLLEHTWISRYRPPFNVQLKDDKSYPFLAVTCGEKAPRLLITRNEKIAGAKYFGPFPKKWALKETVRLLQQIFPIRTCNGADFRRAIESGKPCLAGQIHRCEGPCSQRVTFEEYRERVDQLLRFLQGGIQQHLRKLQERMQAAAQSQQYEEAAKFRDQIQAVQYLLEQNTVVLGFDVDADVFALTRDELLASVHQFIVRGGRIWGERSWLIEADSEEKSGFLLQQVLQSAYTENNVPPPIIYTSEPVTDQQPVQEILSRKRPRGGKIAISVPKRGEKAKLMESAVRNAQEHLQRSKLKRASDIVTRTDALAQLQEDLNLEEAPLRIECIDISHFQGTGTVASLVVFEDGLAKKTAYRKYALDEGNNDVESIYRVVKRRLAKLKAAAEASDATERAAAARNRPQLLIIDGGKPQVAAAARALAEESVTDIALCGIAKRLEELWLPQDAYPVILSRGSEALYLVQRIRDEAHRFAIQFQRKKRSESIASQLHTLKGVGPKRAKTLLKHFSSLARLKAATSEEIAAVKGIGVKRAEEIYKQLHPKK